MILVERRCPDAPEFAWSKCWLQHIGGVHRSIDFSSTCHGVQLVDKWNDLALSLCELSKEFLQSLFEITPELGSSNERSRIKRKKALVLGGFGHIASHHALGQAIGNGYLSHSGLTDQDRVVLRPAREHLHNAPDFFIPADHRI